MAEILILTPQMPYPPRQGTSLRNYHNIRGLSERHQVTLLTFSSESEPTNAVVDSPLTDLCSVVKVVSPPRRTPLKRSRQAISERRPDMALRLHSLEYLDALERLLKQGKFDIVQVEGLELAFALPLIRSVSPESRIVYDAHNAETALQRRALHTDLRSPSRWHAAAYSWLQVTRLRRYELWACQNADWIVAVSESDRQQLHSLAANSNLSITVIPNTIDVGKYQRGEDRIGKKQTAEAASHDEDFRWDLVFIGKMDYRPNVDAVLWFADAIWPHIRAKRPKATWAIVGQKPHSRLDRLKRLDGVIVTGRVDSVLPYLAGASVCIMPFRMGGGTRLKLIEAMAAGKAIVSTTLGAEGFPVTDGRELLVADDAQGFASAILQLIDDPQLREKLGREAEILAMQYDWRQVILKFDEVYRQLV